MRLDFKLWKMSIYSQIAFPLLHVHLRRVLFSSNGMAAYNASAISIAFVSTTPPLREKIERGRVEDV